MAHRPTPWHSWVYLFECNGMHKIGHSISPSRRARHLQTGTPHQVVIIHVLRTCFYRHIERQLHDKFYDKRERGEWFRLEPSDVDYICSLDRSGNDPSDSRYDNTPLVGKVPDDVIRERREIAIVNGTRKRTKPPLWLRRAIRRRQQYKQDQQALTDRA